MHISLDASSVKTVCLKVYQSQATQWAIASALTIIVGLYIWIHNRTQSPTLEQRVTKLEFDVHGFWIWVANCAIYDPRIVTENVWLNKAQSKLNGFQRHIQDLPIAEEGSPLVDRIKNLCDTAACKMSATVSTSSVMQKTGDENELIRQVESYEALADSSKVTPDVLKEHQKTLMTKVNKVYEQTPKQTLFACMVRIHRMGRRLITSKTKLENVKACFSPMNAGLCRNSNNSCYLATAIQLFRSFDALKNQFNPEINPLSMELACNIQSRIHAMITRMDNGETIPAQDGMGLQYLLKEAGILDENVFDPYEADVIAERILYGMGFEFPTGVIQRIKGKDVQEYDFLPAITVLGESIDVCEEIKNLIEKKEIVMDKDIIVGEIIERVTKLPDFIYVQFIPETHGTNYQLVNVERFNDPFHDQYEYELVFAMENTGGHWVAHKKVSENKWITANDALISPMREGALSHIHRGYYLRKAKWTGID